MPRVKRSVGARKKRRKAGQSHNLEHKSPKLKREFRRAKPVSEANDKTVRSLLGIGKRGR